MVYKSRCGLCWKYYPRRFSAHSITATRTIFCWGKSGQWLRKFYVSYWGKRGILSWMGLQYLSITITIAGVPDVMKPSQIGGAALPMLVGTWNYVNETYSGIIKYGKVGDFHLTIPSRNGAQGRCLFIEYDNDACQVLADPAAPNLPLLRDPDEKGRSYHQALHP